MYICMFIVFLIRIYSTFVHHVVSSVPTVNECYQMGASFGQRSCQCTFSRIMYRKEKRIHQFFFVTVSIGRPFFCVVSCARSPIWNDALLVCFSCIFLFFLYDHLKSCRRAQIDSADGDVATHRKNAICVGSYLFSLLDWLVFVFFFFFVCCSPLVN